MINTAVDVYIRNILHDLLNVIDFAYAGHDEFLFVCMLNNVMFVFIDIMFIKVINSFLYCEEVHAAQAQDTTYVL